MNGLENMKQDQQSVPHIRLLAIDIDGTLLDPHMQVTPHTCEAIHAAQQAGVVVTLATARRYVNTRPIADTLGLEIPLVLSDGALIVQHPQAIILQTKALQDSVAQQTVDLMVARGVQPVVQREAVDGVTHMAQEEIWTGPAEYDTTWVRPYFETFPANIHRLPYEQLCTGQPDPLRVVAFTSEELVHRLIPEVSLLDCTWNMIRRGNYGSAELAVLRKDCTKASGVAALARQLDIPMAQVMAIGDNMNDIEMLTQAGWGVAMGQAIASVVAIADAVTTSNAEDGVAVAIERYILAHL
jgi:hydroxymethylpyrimidine pyrophosphatase-like HAD family hydrolase